jgi:hypothetical protein
VLVTGLVSYTQKCKTLISANLIDSNLIDSLALLMKFHVPWESIILYSTEDGDTI